jgi:hypothetical protein
LRPHIRHQTPPVRAHPDLKRNLRAPVASPPVVVPAPCPEACRPSRGQAEAASSGAPMDAPPGIIIEASRCASSPAAHPPASFHPPASSPSSSSSFGCHRTTGIIIEGNCRASSNAWPLRSGCCNKGAGGCGSCRGGGAPHGGAPPGEAHVPLAVHQELLAAGACLVSPTFNGVVCQPRPALLS